MLDARVQTFLREVLLPSYAEIAASPRLAREHAVFVLDDAIDDPLHATLIEALHDGADVGPALLIEELDRTRRPPPFGGRYVVAPVFRTLGDRVVASPRAMYQMQSDRKLHLFSHRYSALADQPVEGVTRKHVLDHVLNSFTSYRLRAFSPVRR